MSKRPRTVAAIAAALSYVVNREQQHAPNRHDHRWRDQRRARALPDAGRAEYGWILPILLGIGGLVVGGFIGAVSGWYQSGQVVLKLKTGWRDGTTHFVM